MTAEPSRQSGCPGCGARQAYRLGDGRNKCRRCGKKYPRRRFRSRLPAKLLKRLALYFWLAAPVASVARDLELNPKTVQRHFELLQQGINRDASALRQQSVEAGEQEAFSLLVTGETSRVESIPRLYPARVTGAGLNYRWCYSEILRLEAPLFETICQVFLADAAIKQLHPHWCWELDKLEKIGQRLCRRRKRRTAITRHLLMNEVAFRFNHRNNPGVTALLYEFFKSRPA